MLDPDLVTVLLFELADEPRVPELRGDAEVFAAAHEGVGLAALAGGGDVVFAEVLAFSAGLGDESFFFPFHISTAFLLFGEGKGGLPAVHDEGVFPRYYLFAYHEFTAGREAPGAGTEGSVEDAAVFDFGEVDYPVWLHFDVYRVEGGHEDGGGFGGEGDGAEAVEGGGPVDS